MTFSAPSPGSHTRIQAQKFYASVTPAWAQVQAEHVARVALLQNARIDVFVVGKNSWNSLYFDEKYHETFKIFCES